MHCGKKWWIREFVTPSIFPLNPDYVAARPLRSLRSNYWIVYGEQSQNLIVTIVYFKYFQVHNTLSFRKSPVLQSAFSRHTYWLFVLFFSILFFQYQGYFVSTLSSLLFLNWSMKGLKFPTVQLRALLAAILKRKKKWPVLQSESICLAEIATFVASVASSLKVQGLELKTQIRHFVN